MNRWDYNVISTEKLRRLAIETYEVYINGLSTEELEAEYRRISKEFLIQNDLYEYDEEFDDLNDGDDLDAIADDLFN